MKDSHRSAIIGYIDSHAEELVGFAAGLVRTKSVNPPGDEREIAAIAAKELEKLGLSPRIMDHGENYRSVTSVVGEEDSIPGIMLNGHLDTVPPGEITWDRDPFSGEIEGGFLYGRGASDMKAGDAAMTYAAAALASSGIRLRGRLKLALSSSEETVSKGAKALASSEFVENLGAVLIAEPTNLDIYTAEKGCFWITVTAKGKTAHGSMPHCGVNAVEGLSDFLRKLRSRWSELGRNPHADLGPTTASVNVFSGGVGTNVVPDMARANVDIRTIPGQDHRALLREMETWASELAKERPGLGISVEVMNDRAPYEISRNHETVELMAKEILSVSGKTPERKAVAFYTDASIFGPVYGLPVVIFGPGDPTMAHQPNERSDIRSIVDAAKIIALWAAERLS